MTMAFIIIAFVYYILKKKKYLYIKEMLNLDFYPYEKNEGINFK